MRVMWVTYAPLGRGAMLIENIQGQSGTWIDATIERLQGCDVTLGVASIASHDCKKLDEKTGVVYYGVSGISRRYGLPKDEKTNDCESKIWNRVFEEFAPDLIMLWGTEFDNGRAVMQAAQGVPKLIYIQGIVGRITQYPVGKVSLVEWVRNLDFFSQLKSLHYIDTQRKQKKQVVSERIMIRECDGIITDNMWADSYLLHYAPNKKIVHIPLTVNKVFLDDKYEQEKTERHSIFTIACGNPAKGTMQLIRAISMIKDQFPDCKVYLPGTIKSRNPEWLFGSSYVKMMKNLICKLGLESNFVFCGGLTPEQMKERLVKSEIFVMCSCIENHSSSLREAMYLGTPCITSEVGSVNEFVRQGENGLLYRYGEVDVLAQNISKLFVDRDYAKQMGLTAYQDIRKKYPQDMIGEQLMSVYEEMIHDESIQ